MADRTTPPGWYDDSRGALRWWDGTQWTEHVQTPDAETGETASDEGIDAAASLPAELAPEGASPAVSAPPGYPGGFPGGTAPSGGFISATEPKKSKLWIVWVVVGIVLLGLVVAIAVLIPLIIGLVNGAQGVSDADRASAVSTVELYDEAWQTGDCDKFQASTTENFREGLQIVDCASFTAASQGFVDSVDDYKLNVTSVQSEDADQVTVLTSETYTSTVDDQGNQTDEALPYEDRYAYILIPAGDGWAIDQALDASE
ncbi:DUF2510 domain-containing protein [Microbacterium sp. NPDC064584]|uniref:DUF2510 domain-containing protein n=1 Tax=Microbacterium sp. NPDC064584 TaxID=3155817 RepID=UPI0034303975